MHIGYDLIIITEIHTIYVVFLDILHMVFTNTYVVIYDLCMLGHLVVAPGPDVAPRATN